MKIRIPPSCIQIEVFAIVIRIASAFAIVA